MTISMSSFASTIGRLVAENAIASEEANRRVRHAAHRANQGQIELQNANQEQANGLRSAMAYVEMAQSGAKAGQAAYGAGQTVAEMSDAAKTQGELGAALRLPRSTSGNPSGNPSAPLESLRLGEQGPTVGERFNALQLDALASGDGFPHSKDGLMAIGFSESEAEELVELSQEGLSKAEAARFMWDHRATQAQKNDAHIQQKLQEALIDETVKALGRGVGQATKRLGEEGKRAGETGAQLAEIAARAREATSKHFQAIDRIELEAIRNRGPQKSTKA